MHASKRLSKPDTIPKNSKLPFSDSLRFGCEFEFYLQKNKLKKDLEKSLLQITGSDILINYINQPKEEDNNECLCLKTDTSLDVGGLEISVPISSYETILYYMREISLIIIEYGSTGYDTGFHIHISCELHNKSEDYNEMDFFAFLLLIEEQGLLTSWEGRNRFCLNPMEILNNLSQKEAKELKNSKGRIWSIERRGKAHVEIRTMGGPYYQNKIPLIEQELEKYIEIFKKTLSGSNLMKDSKYIELLKKHKVKLKDTSAEKLERYQDFIASILPI